MKMKLLLVVNPLLLVAMLLQIVTGIAMKKFDAGWAHSVHMNNAIILDLLFLFHIILNWGWIKTNLLRLKK
ncbi:DUF4405 domain-containing protein [bacterium]|nr:DUF4405 domain-containing protein [bacterium]